VGFLIHGITSVAKALSDPNRVRILAGLLGKKEICVCEIAAFLGLAMATVSRHVSILQTAGLVESRKDGRWVHYRLADAGFPARAQLLLDWIRTECKSDPLVIQDRKTIRRAPDCSSTGKKR
jgi:ArsR family transcriptional regulator